jgi:hypothetical protein
VRLSARNTMQSLVANLLLLAGDRLRLALAGAGVGVRTLATDGELATMAQATVAAKVHKSLDVHCNFAAKIAFDHIITVDRLADLKHFRVSQLIDPTLRRNIDFLANFRGLLGTNAMNILKRDDNALCGRNIDACYTGH